MELSQNALLMKISEIQFVCVELQLYLDTHPSDEDAKADFLCYGRKLKALIRQYEENFGPLMNYGHSPTEAGCWVNSRWPWEL